MIKYRQLHLDSNHGFIRLDDGKTLKSVLQKHLDLCREYILKYILLTVYPREYTALNLVLSHIYVSKP